MVDRKRARARVEGEELGDIDIHKKSIGDKNIGSMEITEGGDETRAN